MLPVHYRQQQQYHNINNNYNYNTDGNNNNMDNRNDKSHVRCSVITVNTVMRDDVYLCVQMCTK